MSQNRSYDIQLLEKEASIRQIFGPLLENQVLIHPIIGCQNPWQYRNKMEFSFSQNKAGDYFLGLMMKGKRRVVDLLECHLVSPWFVTREGTRPADRSSPPRTGDSGRSKPRRS